MTPDPTPLTEAVTAFITRGEEDPAAFDRLARAVFAYQYRRNGPYRTFCDGRGAAPENLASWQDIPAAPAVALP